MKRFTRGAVAFAVAAGVALSVTVPLASVSAAKAPREDRIIAAKAPREDRIIAAPREDRIIAAPREDRIIA